MKCSYPHGHVLELSRETVGYRFCSRAVPQINIGYHTGDSDSGENNRNRVCRGKAERGPGGPRITDSGLSKLFETKGAR